MHNCFAGKSPPLTCPTRSPPCPAATSSPQPSAAGLARPWAAVRGWAVRSWLGCKDAWGSGRLAGGAERGALAHVRVFSKKLFARGGPFWPVMGRVAWEDWMPDFTGMRAEGGGAQPGEGTAVRSGGLAGVGWRETRALGGTARDQGLVKRAPSGVAANKLLTHRRTSPGEGTTIQSSRQKTAQVANIRGVGLRRHQAQCTLSENERQSPRTSAVGEGCGREAVANSKGPRLGWRVDARALRSAGLWRPRPRRGPVDLTRWGRTLG